MVADAAYLNQTNSELKVLTALVSAIGNVSIIPAPTPGALGTYALARSSAAVAFGASVPGSDLTPSNAAGTSTGGALTGSWACVGTIGAAGDVSLFVRVA
jgi:hypothetical protein